MPDVRDYAREEAMRRFGRPAQGMFDEILFPWNLRDLVQETDAEYERINAQARGMPGWDVEYQSWKTFFQANKDPGWLSSSQETAQAIRRRQAKLADWQKQLSQKGIQTGPAVTVAGPAPLVEPPASGWSGFGQGLERVAKYAAWGVGLYVVGKTIGLGEKLSSRRKGTTDV